MSSRLRVVERVSLGLGGRVDLRDRVWLEIGRAKE